MPVIGHLFVGMVIAQQFGSGDEQPRAHASRLRALWLPAIVALSYVPDVLTQIGVWLHFHSAQAAGHSVLVGCIAGMVFGTLWSRLTGTSSRRAIIIATGAILLHDALDLLQDVERMPLWPFSSRQFGVDWLMLTDRLSGEALVFGVPFALYQMWRVATKRPLLGREPATRGVRWTALLVVCGVLALTTTLVQLRAVRDDQLRRAEHHLRAGRFDEALASATAAERWPAAAGRGDLLKGRIYAAMGDDARAESLLLRAYARDPGAFWTTAALAEFHASRGPAETRRARVAPFLDALRARFATHDALPRVIEQIERDLTR